MKWRNRLLFVPALLLLMGAGVPPIMAPLLPTIVSPMLGSDTLSIRNNSSSPLKCTTRIPPSGKWSRWRTIAPGQAWGGSHLPDRMILYCAAPARHVQYLLRKGQRYSLLREADGTITLRNIDLR